MVFGLDVVVLAEGAGPGGLAGVGVGVDGPAGFVFELVEVAAAGVQVVAVGAAAAGLRARPCAPPLRPERGTDRHDDQQRRTERSLQEGPVMGRQT